jgi:uncharacterized membrane protein YtjA (UPF0391 family)
VTQTRPGGLSERLHLIRVRGDAEQTLSQQPNFHTITGRAFVMLRWAIVFLVIALIAGALGLSGVAGTSSNIAWILFVVFLILMVVSFIFGGLRGRGGVPPV